MTLAVATFLSTSTTGLVVMPLASPPGTAALCYLGQRHMHDLLLFACVMWCIGKLYNLQPFGIMHLSPLVMQIHTIDQEHLHL